MAAINDLISRIQDPELRAQIQAEVNKLSRQKKFGLVFEDHIPECTPLYELPIRVGTLVAKKDGSVNDLMMVTAITDGKASRVAEKAFTITNWIITAAALLLGITSFTIDQVNDLLPGRNQVLFAGGMLIAGVVACPLLMRPKVKDFVIGEMDQKKKHAIQLVVRLVIALAVIAATFYFFGRGW